MQGWCGGGVELVQGWCRGGAGVVWVSLGVTATVIDVNWVTQALCSDVMVRGDVGVEGVGRAVPSSNM